MIGAMAIVVALTQGQRPSSEYAPTGYAGLREPADELAVGPWRAWLDSPGGELPFGLEFVRADSELTSTIVNGEERIAVPRTVAEGSEIVLDLPHYDASIRARITPFGTRLSGEWKKRSGPDRWTTLPFHAEAGSAPRFRVLEDTPTGSLRGRFAVKFEKSDDPAVAVLRAGVPAGSRSAIEGTFLTTTGDYRWLAGSFEGERLRLSCFDGAHAFLFDATADEHGVLRGTFWSGDRWSEKWEARPDDNAALPDDFEQVHWKEGFPLGDLRFPDLDGTVRSLADPEFAGRAVVIQVLGSWCPNCHDETSYLARLYDRYHERGLSIIGLAFEVSGDAVRDAEQVRRLRARHSVNYPILLAGVSDKTKAAEQIPALDRVRAFPTTVFLHADGRVRAVHSGFAGPAAKLEHEKLTKRFESLIRELIAE
jgi:thiol-disulfide isomerase/thioredoxin